MTVFNHPFTSEPNGPALVWTTQVPNLRDLHKDHGFVTETGIILIGHGYFRQIANKTKLGEQVTPTRWEDLSIGLELEYHLLQYTYVGRTGTVVGLTRAAALAFIEKNSELFTNQARDKEIVSKWFDAQAEMVSPKEVAAEPEASGQAIEEPIGALVPHRNLDGIDIPQRVGDGYVNISAFLRAASKRLGREKTWSDYARIAANIEFMMELCSVLGIPRTADFGHPALIWTRQGGVPELQGTYVGPRLAIDVARWADPKLAVLMNGWCHDWMKEGRAPAPAPQTIEDELGRPQPVDFLSALEGMVITERARLLERSGRVEAEGRATDLEEAEGILSAKAGWMSPRVAAKSVDQKPIAFFDYITEHMCGEKDHRGWKYPLQKFIDSGHLDFKYWDKNANEYAKSMLGTRVKPQIFVSQKGANYIAKKMRDKA